MGLIERYKAFKQKDRRAAKAKLKKDFLWDAFNRWVYSIKLRYIHY